MYPKVTLKSQRAAAVQSGHPWIFSGAVDAVEPEVSDGGLVSVFGEGGHFIGHGYYNGKSSIRVRLLSREPEAALDEAWWHERLAGAIGLRSDWFGGAEGETNAYRLVNGEGDGLPGLIVDRYGDHVVLQIHTLGMDRRRELLVAGLRKLLRPAAIVERSDVAVRSQEGLRPLPARVLDGDVPEGGVEIVENGLRYRVDLLAGQKTGFYLDQRDNRAAFGRLATGRRVLNGFAYTGGFSVAALRGGASAVTSVEVSAPALERLEENLRLNGLGDAAHEAVCGEVAPFLEARHGAGERYGAVVLDPPAFVKHRAAMQSGLKGYRRLNRLAMRLLPPGGVLVTASCSSHVNLADWEGVLYAAARAEGRQVQVLMARQHPVDHPVHLQCPEGAYLKCLFLRMLD